MPISNGIHYLLHEGGNPNQLPMVLIHGAAGYCLSWPPEIRRLTGNRVFAIDLPGHGKSGGPYFQTVPEYADCLVGFLNSLGIWKAIFIGHSMGGAIALTLAVDQPERVAGLGLISTGANMPIAASILENAANPVTFILALQSFQGLMNLPQAAKHINDQVFKDLSSIRPTLFLGDLNVCNQYDLDACLSYIRTPVLIICGTSDRLTPQRYSEHMAKKIPGAALQTIDDAGHMVMLEQPRRVSALLRVFLNAIPYY